LDVRSAALRTFLWIVPFLALGSTTSGQVQFALRDVNGVEHRQSEWTSKRAIVLFFKTTECPISNSYIPEMNRLQKEYVARGVAFYAIEADTTVTDNDVRRHAKEFGFTFPVLIDRRQTLVRLSGATATPEVAVLSNAGKVLYLGRIDNRVEDFDKRRNVVTEHDLKDALDAVLAGKAAPKTKTRAVGCAINILTETNKP
jgi:thiol-disulfide isomerase/thioredoxin